MISPSLRNLQRSGANLFTTTDPQHLLKSVSSSAPSLTPAQWNHLFRSSADSLPCPDLLLSYRTMLRENIPPNGASLSAVLRKSVDLPKASMAGESLHCHILKMGFTSDRFLQTGLLDFYSKTGCLSSAEQVFDEMPDRDVIATNAMIVALGSYDRVTDARKLFDAIPEKSPASWNSMITCYCRQRDLSSAREIFEWSPVKNAVSWNSIIDGYCKVGQMGMARELFDQDGCTRNSVTWSTMISGYLHCGDFAAVISMFRMMQVKNVKPNEVTLVSLLSACAHLGAFNMGRWVHMYIRKYHLKVDVFLGNALIDMYFKCGNVDSAMEVFHGMGEKNIFCWNSVIAGLGMHGYGERSIQVFSKMDVNADGVTFIGLLSGCSHSGLVCEGKRYFSQMVKVYGVDPMVEHYGCMVDLLGRAGVIEEALLLVKTMPFQPNHVIWGGLFRACKIRKDTRVSEKVMEHVLQLDPNDGGNYVFLSNVYASANCWEEVESCRRTMIERGVRKIPGCSSIEVNNVIHEFLVRDTSHPQFDKINEFLVEIFRVLRNLGYQPSTDSVLHDVEDEEKENEVMYHSEKIAIAFGLMSTKGKVPIRVVKNLRVCSDCHHAIKLISKLFEREIIVRDRKRFHRFKDGTCSCNDYW